MIGILLLAMLVAGIYTVLDKKRLLAIALLLAIPMFGGRWSNYFYTDPVLLEIDYGFGAMFFLFNAITIMPYVLQQKKRYTRHDLRRCMWLPINRCELGVYIFVGGIS